MAPSELGETSDKRPALALEYSSFEIPISKTQSFQLLLLNIMDLRNKIFLMMLLFDFLEIFHQDLFASTIYSHSSQ